jgi:hypothetical protein
LPLKLLNCELGREDDHELMDISIERMVSALAADRHQSNRCQSFDTPLLKPVALLPELIGISISRYPRGIS